MRQDEEKHLLAVEKQLSIKHPYLFSSLFLINLAVVQLED